MLHQGATGKPALTSLLEVGRVSPEDEKGCAFSFSIGRWQIESGLTYVIRTMRFVRPDKHQSAKDLAGRPALLVGLSHQLCNP